MSMFKKYARKTTSAEHDMTPMGKKEIEPKQVDMIPLFSLRSMIILAIGLIIGAGLGLGYWILNPSLSSSDATDSEQGLSGLSEFIGEPREGPYECVLNIQVVSPGSTYTSMKDLQRRGEYFAGRASSLVFLESISQQLAEQAPEYYHTTDELKEMLMIRYDWNSEIPAIELKVIGSNDQEAYFLAGFVPEAFENYLIAKAKEVQQKEYENTLIQIESIKTVLIEAEQELRTFMPQIINPAYFALNAKITALESELQEQAQELSILVVSGDIDEYGSLLEKEYQQTLQEVKTINTALSEAKQRLQTLEIQKASSSSSSNDSYLIILGAKIRALEIEIGRLMTGDNDTTGLADMIARGITSGTMYVETTKKVEKVSTALAEAKKELAILESQLGGGISEVDLDYYIVQAEISTLNTELSVLQVRLIELSRERTQGQNQPDIIVAVERTSIALAEAKKELAILESQSGGDSLAIDLDYQVAQAKISNLNRELANINEISTSLLGDNTDAEGLTDYLVAGNPSLPVPILPERARARNALMAGAIVGIGGAWVIVNFRWLRKRLTSSPTTSSRTLDEEEEES